jgi:hypothetical protein
VFVDRGAAPTMYGDDFRVWLANGRGLDSTSGFAPPWVSLRRSTQQKASTRVPSSLFPGALARCFTLGSPSVMGPDRLTTTLAELDRLAAPLKPRPQATHKTASRVDLRWVSTLAICTALGLAFVAIADAGSRQGNTATSVFFWVGLLLIFAPTASRLLSHNVGRQERLALVILLNVGLYLVKVLSSPSAFTFTDEYTHLRSTQDILQTEHLFSFNPLLPTAAFYPGLAAITAGLVALTGLSPFVGGLLIIGVARLLIAVCFFLVAERVTGTPRAAAAAGLIYFANPLFLFWSAAFAYENLALPLAAFAVWWLARTRRQASFAPQIITALAIVAVTVIHHVAGFALAALLSAWWLAELFTRRTGAARRRVAFMALLSTTAAVIWLVLVAPEAMTYLFAQNLLPALQQTASVVLGYTAARHFYTSGGYASPVWEVVAGIVATGLLILALPPALWLAWRHRTRAPMAAAIGVAALFPLSLLPRLAPAGVTISGRSSEYIYTGLACVAALLVTADAGWWRTSRRRVRRRRRSRRDGFPRRGWRRVAVGAALVTATFIGNITIGTASYELLPESSSPTGYPWSVQPDVVSASNWAREHLGSDQRFAANAIDAQALATSGAQDPVAENDIWQIFFAETVDASVLHTIRSTGVHYLLLDWRITLGVPPTPGYYFSPQEPNAGNYTTPFPVSALLKFASAPCMNVVYDSGSIQIVDVTPIENGSCVP